MDVESYTAISFCLRPAFMALVLLRFSIKRLTTMASSCEKYTN